MVGGRSFENLGCESSRAWKFWEGLMVDGVWATDVSYGMGRFWGWVHWVERMLLSVFIGGRSFVV